MEVKLWTRVKLSTIFWYFYVRWWCSLCGALRLDAQVRRDDSGHRTDATGLAVPKAEISITNTATGV